MVPRESKGCLYLEYKKRKFKNVSTKNALHDRRAFWIHLSHFQTLTLGLNLGLRTLGLGSFR
jgi:hypothetical protein